MFFHRGRSKSPIRGWIRSSRVSWYWCWITIAFWDIGIQGMYGMHSSWDSSVGRISKCSIVRLISWGFQFLLYRLVAIRAHSF